MYIYIYTLQVPIENAYVPHHFNMYECIHFLGGYLEGLGRCDVGKLYKNWKLLMVFPIIFVVKLHCVMCISWFTLCETTT